METKFEKVFLSFNEEGYKSEVENFEKQCEYFNLQIGNLRRVLRNLEDFTKDEKLQIKDNAFEFLSKYIKENLMTFKNADLDFNLEAIGMTELKGILEEWKRRTNEWKASEMELNKRNRFEITEHQIQSFKERNTKYTATPEQNKRLELAKKLEVILNEAVSMKMISVYNRPSIAKTIQGLSIGVSQESKNYEFVVDAWNV